MDNLQEVLQIVRHSELVALIRSIDPYLGNVYFGIGLDKYLHVLASFVLMTFFYFLFKKDTISSAETVVFLMVSKEVFDLLIKQSYFSYLDIGAGLIGVFLFLFIAGIKRTERVKI